MTGTRGRAALQGRVTGGDPWDFSPGGHLLGESASGRDSGHMQETGIYVQFWEGNTTVKCARVETIFPLASLMQVPADHQLTSFLHRADAARAGAGTERDEVCI